MVLLLAETAENGVKALSTIAHVNEETRIMNLFVGIALRRRKGRLKI